MIVPAAIMIAMQATDAPDIVVTGERLRRLRISTNINRRGQVRRCEVTVSSGDASIDRQACLSTRVCVTNGYRGGEGLANCVDTALIAFVRAGRGEQGNDNAQNH